MTLSPGFIAERFTDQAPGARHMAIAENGDVVVALEGVGENPGGVRVFRDVDGDGVADTVAAFGEGTGSDVEFQGGFLYFASRGDVVRYPWQVGQMLPVGPPDTVVTGLPARNYHSLKTIAFDSSGALYVNIGSTTNVCTPTTVDDRDTSLDPCPELEERAGIWRFDPTASGQSQTNGVRFVSGVRNAVALARDGGSVYAVIHGRDRLHQKYPEFFDEEESAELPSEEFIRLQEGDDYGYPYCFYDHRQQLKVLAPEYGGDGLTQGRCSAMTTPLLGFPGHWAPNDLLFYGAEQFPERYRGGAFITFHGSWNRDPLPQGGYNVVFVPFVAGEPAGDYEIFANGFAGDPPRDDGRHRPVGLAVGPDGSLFVSDDRSGWIYRIRYVGLTPPS
ncbi:MAG: sorbosone dehydrogenase [Longimicrobiales bacterium]